MALLLFALENGVYAFVPHVSFELRSTFLSMATDDLLPDSSTLPPLTTKPRRKPRRNNSRKHKTEEWDGRDIPSNLPKLSEVMKDVSVQEFAGEVAIAPPPIKTSTSNKRRRNQNASNQNDTQRNNSPTTTIRQQSQQQQNQHQRRPWRAGYNVSTQTQARIKEAGSNSRSNIDRATAVLQTLLNTPPYKCNEANVVCALTTSAKAMLPSTPITPKFRSLLMKTLDILHQLVLDKRLNARQLCNAVWAIAKHYNRDASILPPPPETAAMSTEDMLGVAEAWILQAESDASPEKRVKETADLIATQLTDILERDDARKPKVGELCMACWAYGVLQPRRRPPGWAVPPQLGRIPNSNKKQRKQQSNVEFVTFEQWTQEDNDDEEFGNGTPEGVIDRFFDAAGNALCEPVEDESKGRNNSDYDDWGLGAPLMESCSWKEIANVAWAYASHGYCQTPSSEAVIRGLADEAAIRLRESQAVQPRDIAQLVWAIGTLQSDNFRLADDLVVLLDAVACHWGLVETHAGTTMSNQRPLHQWSCPDLVQLAISSAHGRIDNRPLLRAVYEEALFRLQDTDGGAYTQRKNFRLWEVSVLLWAQARLYLREPEGQVFEKFASEAPKWLVRSIDQNIESLEDIGIGDQEQANLAWSLTVLEQYESEDASRLLKAIFKEASASSEKRHVIQLEHAHQLWQALYMLEEDCPSAVVDVPRWFRDYLQEKWSVEKARRKKSSARHRSLSDTLKLMNVAHFNEHDEDIDVAIVLREGASWTSQTTRAEQGKFKVAVEFDGPNHFTRETGMGEQPRALGHTVFKYRLLKREGWTVVRVPYYEFDKIPFWASQERQRYLQRLLKTHANLRFSAVDVSEYKAPVPNRQTRFD